ncbi:hypothetical protein, variant 1 [Aphanomyces invadans]|uniref:Uncharacterized protein n=1 Tax=Aphanomyces invadans TaxID=157072 RepID=A0A024U8X6_9STRA|nr:hypothetical protein, variant 1 [Aphanomyces invadans]ETW02058.1 hypothetical protein, variant 1 [Aphanomyces invadans]|eukprot:XP_008868663.1 hypothetical protein, variant 1 [Aphanomyces invadans]
MGACTSKSGPRRMDTWAAGDPDAAATEGRSTDATLPATERDGNIYLHDSNTPVSCVVTTTGNVCASGWDDGTIKLIDFNARCVVRSWSAHSRSVNRMVVGARSSSLYSCSRDTTIVRHSLIDTLSTAAPTTFAGHSLTVSALALDPTETRLASGSRDTSVILWDAATATQMQHTSTSQNIVTCMAWVPTEAQVVAQGGEDLRLRFWDARTWKTPAQTIEGYVYFPLAMACSLDGHYVFTSSKGFNAVGCEGRVWDRRTGKQVVEMTGHSQDATACAFLPHHADEGITASKDSSVRVWNTMTGELLASTQDGGAGMFTSLACVEPASKDDQRTRILASSFSGRIDMYEWDRTKRSLELV